MSGGTCDVCGGSAIGVASSGLGAVSFAYCQRCVYAGAEPYGMLVATVAMNGGLDACAEWVTRCVDATLPIAGKTREEFDADVKRDADDFDKYMAGE